VAVPPSAGNPVNVGPYKRIVGVNWPQLRFVTVPFSFDHTLYSDNIEASSPSDIWTSGIAAWTDWMTADDIQWMPGSLLPGTLAGEPSLQSVTGSFFQWHVKSGGIGSWYGNDAYIVQDLTGPEITDGPTFAGGAYARADTSITVDAMRTPYTEGGIPTYYSNLGWPDGPRLAQQFSGLSDPTPSLANTSLVGSLTFDFSGTTLTVERDIGPVVYEAVGLFVPMPMASYLNFPNDARDIGVIYLLLERQGSA
jgi:hypothetical protein